MPAEDIATFNETVAELYAEIMDAETSYAAVSFRDDEAVFLGRADGEDVVVLKAEIRSGRTFDRKRRFALDVIDLVNERFDVPLSNQKVVFTEHEGEQMMGNARVGGDWHTG
ncbi:tautomerase [Halobacterium hubeiense]|uniref:tautomerase n=1 Tax=Halobacterium hubeiense TaxID=1407499 RepID=UPI001C4F184D|nr:tautomerase [Halobacterium hubeiense]